MLFKKFNGGLFVFPAAPALANIDTNYNYYKALKHADYALFDSAFFRLLLFLFYNIKATKFSGLTFIVYFINFLKNNRSLKIFFVEASKKQAIKNKIYLKKNKIYNFKQYIAPQYLTNDITDKELVKQINLYKPDFVILNLGGLTQEVLGSYLKYNLHNKTNILCLGAALAFRSGNQGYIPLIVDKINLAWLFRCIYNPKTFIVRYLSAFKLFFIIWSYWKKNK